MVLAFGKSCSLFCRGQYNSQPLSTPWENWWQKLTCHLSHTHLLLFWRPHFPCSYPSQSHSVHLSQLSKETKSCNFYLLKISPTRRFSPLLLSLSPLEYCNLSGSCLHPPLRQAILNSATKVNFLKFKYDHVAPQLKNFQWFSLAVR